MLNEFSTTPRKSFFKKFPFLSPTLLLLSYCNFGWTLSVNQAAWWVWLLSTLLILVVAEALAAPLSIIRALFNRLICSDTRAFFSVIVAAFFGVILLTWINVSGIWLILIVAAALVRLDIQIAGFTEVQAFLSLTFLSLIGLGLGWSIYHFDQIVNVLFKIL